MKPKAVMVAILLAFVLIGIAFLMVKESRQDSEAPVAMTAQPELGVEESAKAVDQPAPTFPEPKAEEPAEVASRTAVTLPEPEVEEPKSSKQAEKQPVEKQVKEEDEKKTGVAAAKVTFIELGSVNCIPCKMMQPIMKEIEDEYKGQVEVVFYDVWTPEGRPYGQKYKIRVIPTQVFLDKDGKEYFRHQGFFPKDELVNVLKMKGIK